MQALQSSTQVRSAASAVHGAHGLLVFAFGLLLGMLGQRIREQVTGYGRLIVFVTGCVIFSEPSSSSSTLRRTLSALKMAVGSPARKSRISSTDISAASAPAVLREPHSQTNQAP